MVFPRWMVRASAFANHVPAKRPKLGTGSSEPAAGEEGRCPMEAAFRPFNHDEADSGSERGCAGAAGSAPAL